jgi:hypothetical protein
VWALFKKDLKGKVCEGMNWSHAAHDGFQGWVLVNLVTNLLVLKISGVY